MKKIKIQFMCVLFSLLLTACADTVQEKNTSKDVTQEYYITTQQNIEMQNTETIDDSVDISRNDTNIPTYDNNSNISTIRETDDQKLNASDFVLNVKYTPIYDNVCFAEISDTGASMSYEELQEYIGAYEDISFVGYEILYQYTPEEAFKKTGSDIFINSTTLYKAHIFYDYLNDTTVDLTVDIAKAGMPNKQIKGNPPYAIGQKIISALSGFSRTRCVAIPELVFLVYNVNGTDLAYHVNCSDITISDDSFENLDMQLVNEEYSFTTTTKNNPVIFNQKSTIYDLTQFIKQDWEKRGYDFTDILKEKGTSDYRNENDDVKVVD